VEELLEWVPLTGEFLAVNQWRLQGLYPSRPNCFVQGRKELCLAFVCPAAGQSALNSLQSRLTRLVVRLASCSLWSFCASVSSPAACLITSCSAPFQYRLPSVACLPSMLLACTLQAVKLANAETKDIANEPCLMT